MEGVDYSGGPISGADLKAAGKQFAVGYCVHRNDIHTLTKAEYDDHVAHGIVQLGIWERTANYALGGFKAGVAAMDEEIQYLLDQGINPDGKPLYVILNDWDVTENEKPAVNEFAKGAASVRGPALAGGYGSYWMVKYCVENGNPLRYYWQTYAWSGGLWHPAAQLQQYSNSAVRIGGVDCDLDRATAADFGQWPTTIQGADMTPDEHNWLQYVYTALSATDAAKDPHGNPIDDHWAVAYTLGEAYGLHAKIDALKAELDALTAAVAKMQAPSVAPVDVASFAAAVAKELGVKLSA